VAYTFITMPIPLKFNDEKKAAYLTALEEVGEVSSAAAAVGLHRTTKIGRASCRERV